jgi:hypothetical protein
MPRRRPTSRYFRRPIFSAAADLPPRDSFTHLRPAPPTPGPPRPLPTARLCQRCRRFAASPSRFRQPDSLPCHVFAAIELFTRYFLPLRGGARSPAAEIAAYLFTATWRMPDASANISLAGAAACLMRCRAELICYRCLFAAAGFRLSLASVIIFAAIPCHAAECRAIPFHRWF